MTHIENAIEPTTNARRSRWGVLCVVVLLYLAMAASTWGQVLTGGFAVMPSPQGEYVVFVGQFQKPMRKVTVECVNEMQDQKIYVICDADVFPGYTITVSPAEGWFWQPGEKLVVRSPSLDDPQVIRMAAVNWCCTHRIASPSAPSSANPFVILNTTIQ